MKLVILIGPTLVRIAAEHRVVDRALLFLDILGPWCQRLTLELVVFVGAPANTGQVGGAGFQRTASHEPLTNTLAIAR